MTAAPVPELRPLGLGQLLDHAIRLYRRNFLTLIGIIAIMQIPVTLLQIVFAAIMTRSQLFQILSNPEAIATLDNPFSLFDANYFIGILGSIGTGLVAIILIQGIATTAATRAIGDSYMGQPTGIIDAYRKSGRAWLRVAGVLIIAYTVSTVIWGMVFVIVFVFFFFIPIIGIILGWLLLVATAGAFIPFWFMIMPLVAPLVLLERQGIFGAIRRAWELVRRRFWWVLGFVFVLLLFSQIVVAAPTFVASFFFQFVLGDPFNPSGTQLILQTVAQSATGLLFSLLYSPLYITCITLLYFDLRVRTEGFDLALQSAGLSGEPISDITDLISQAPATIESPLITLKELGYFALISGGAAALTFIIIIAFIILIGLAALLIATLF